MSYEYKCPITIAYLKKNISKENFKLNLNGCWLCVHIKSTKQT
jgi:hypothetical protein